MGVALGLAVTLFVITYGITQWFPGFPLPY